MTIRVGSLVAVKDGCMREATAEDVLDGRPVLYNAAFYPGVETELHFDAPRVPRRPFVQPPTLAIVELPRISWWRRLLARLSRSNVPRAVAQ